MRVVDEIAAVSAGGNQVLPNPAYVLRVGFWNDNVRSGQPAFDDTECLIGC